MGHLAKQRDASFFRVFFNPYRYGVLTDYSPRRNAPVDRFFCSLIFEIIHRLVGNTVQLRFDKDPYFSTRTIMMCLPYLYYLLLKLKNNLKS